MCFDWIDKCEVRLYSQPSDQKFVFGKRQPLTRGNLITGRQNWAKSQKKIGANSKYI